MVIFGSSDENGSKQQDLITVFLNRQVDAFILSPAAGTESQINLLRTRGIPVVLIDRYLGNARVDPVYINNFQAAYKAVEHLLNPLELDAILFASNSLAIAGLNRVQHYNFRVPQQLAVISFDEAQVFDLFYSPVTYISQSVGEIGKEAVRMADERIRHLRKNSKKKIVDATLVLRESSGSGPGIIFNESSSHQQPVKL